MAFGKLHEQRRRMQLKLFPCLALAACTLFGQNVNYEGPSIISRGMSPAPAHRPAPFRIRPFLILSAAYDAGLAPSRTDQQGHITTDLTSVSAIATFGLAGTHFGR